MIKSPFVQRLLPLIIVSFPGKRFCYLLLFPRFKWQTATTHLPGLVRGTDVGWGQGGSGRQSCPFISGVLKIPFPPPVLSRCLPPPAPVLMTGSWPVTAVTRVPLPVGSQHRQLLSLGRCLRPERSRTLLWPTSGRGGYRGVLLGSVRPSSETQAGTRGSHRARSAGLRPHSWPDG